MSDQKENNSVLANRKRISWKNAFHLLKQVALRNFKLKYLDDYGHRADVVIEYALANENSSLAQSSKIREENVKVPDLDDSKVKLNSNNLALTILNGIINEIKSGNSSRKSQPTKRIELTLPITNQFVNASRNLSKNVGGKSINAFNEKSGFPKSKEEKRHNVKENQEKIVANDACSILTLGINPQSRKKEKPRENLILGLENVPKADFILPNKVDTRVNNRQPKPTDQKNQDMDSSLNRFKGKSYPLSQTQKAISNQQNPKESRNNSKKPLQMTKVDAKKENSTKNPNFLVEKASGKTGGPKIEHIKQKDKEASPKTQIVHSTDYAMENRIKQGEELPVSFVSASEQINSKPALVKNENEEEQLMDLIECDPLEVKEQDESPKYTEMNRTNEPPIKIEQQRDVQLKVDFQDRIEPVEHINAHKSVIIAESSSSDFTTPQNVQQETIQLAYNDTPSDNQADNAKEPFVQPLEKTNQKHDDKNRELNIDRKETKSEENIKQQNVQNNQSNDKVDDLANQNEKETSNESFGNIIEAEVKFVEEKADDVISNETADLSGDNSIAEKQQNLGEEETNDSQDDLSEKHDDKRFQNQTVTIDTVYDLARSDNENGNKIEHLRNGLKETNEQLSTEPIANSDSDSIVKEHLRTEEDMSRKSSIPFNETSKSNSTTRIRSPLLFSYRSATTNKYGDESSEDDESEAGELEAKKKEIKIDSKMSGFEDDTDEEVYIVRRQDSDKLGGTKTERASKKPNEVVKKSSEYDPTHYTSARDHTNIVNESLKYSNNKKNSKTKRIDEQSEFDKTQNDQDESKKTSRDEQESSSKQSIELSENQADDTNEVPNENANDAEQQQENKQSEHQENQEPSPAQSEKQGKKKSHQKVEMDPDFYYDYESLVFQPVISEESSISAGYLNLYHSFGYDCHKRANLHLIDSDILIFSAGNLVEILNIKTKEQKYLKTSSGGAVGAIAVHPSRKYFAVGEKGNQPNINIFEYPSLKLYRVLRKGTIKGYAHMDFDPTGNLLASLGSAPDFMLTIWDWRNELVVLRTKAFSQDVFKVTFSKDLKGILTSAGTGHIKFWKMANTFTGYKLQGDLGKFGKTEISDIEGYAELPDGKVLSGTEWGNMLLWDGGLIQTEICRKKNKNCHTGSIQQITLNEGDIYTIGDDGSIRVWDFETIDTSEPSEEGVKLELEPLNELKVGNNVSLKSMVKDFAEESTVWYAQDANGGIWCLDLGFSAQSENPKQLFSFHSGVINAIETCPNSHLFATTADDGSIKVYNYTTCELVAQKKFNRPGKCLKWLSTDIDPEAGTLAVGFDDGVLRFLKLAPKATHHASDLQYDLILFEVFKPHTKAIRCISIDPKSSFIATGSDDQTIFFFSNAKNVRVPVGYVNIPSAVTFMTWTPKEYNSQRLLVCMRDGNVYEIELSAQAKFDTTKSYLIESKVKMRKYTFKSIKSRLRHEEELERKRIEEEERKKKELEERRLRGLDDEDDKKKKGKKSEEGKQSSDSKAAENEEEKSGEKKEEEEEENEENQPKEDEWKPYIPEVPSKICWAQYSSPDTFWLSMDDYDAGYLYECKFLDEAQKSKMSAEKVDEPFKAVPVVKSDITHSEDIPFSCMIYDKNRSVQVIGQKNGVIRVQPMPESKLVEDIKHYWSYGYHDNEYGHITHLSLSYDEKFLFSAGADSNIFGILFNSSMEALENAKKEPIRVTYKNAMSQVQDIDDSAAYSIEQSKLKAEQDKMIAVAETKKQEMRQKITELRKMFRELLVKNDQLVPRLKLSKNEFMLEESIKTHVLNQINEKINLTYRELAWYSEKCRISLEKLQKKFKDVIDCDHVVVFSFDQEYNVSSFRTVCLPKDMEEYKNELQAQYMAKLAEKQKNQENFEIHAASDLKSTITDLKGEETTASELLKKLFGRLKGATAARVERALKKMEEKKMKRLKRKREWEELHNSRLPDNYENPEDLASIKYAEDNIGDFKLKSSLDYVVPENQRMNVFKAVERLMQIKEFIHKNQMIFNKKILELRDNKKDLVEEINRNIDRLQQIQFILGQPIATSIARPSLKPEEIPEKKYEYTKERLIEFKKELETKSNKASMSSEDDGNFGGFNNNSNVPGKKSATTRDDANKLFDGLKPLWENKDNLTEFMKQTLKAEEIRLMFEQKQIINSIEEKMKLFNMQLKVLRHEKARIGVYMKNADLRHVTIFEEFMLLRDFEKTENELEQKLAKRKEEHLEVQLKSTDIQLKIDSKKKDIEKLEENLKHLLNTFNHMTHDETKYGDFLLKVYKRKIKRKKKVEGAEEDEESEEESDESDDEDEDLDDEEENSDDEGKEQLDLDICPSGVKQELYDQVCQLREKRLDYEEMIVEEKKVLEQFKKDYDSFVKKVKLAENSLKQVQQELENFQKEKQKKINNLDIVVTLRLNQLQYLKNGVLPADLSETLAFDAHNLDRLQSRIRELQDEKFAEKKLFKNLKHRHQELIRDKKKMDEYVEKLDALCNKMMTDKFGKLVDIERLEIIAVNQQIEELKQKLAENEFEHERVMQEWLNKINNEKDDSVEMLKANTNRVNEMIDILTDTKRLDKDLDSKQTSLGEEMSGASRKDVEERQRLHTLVQLQAQEIEALKAEITILSRKGGHILPPTQLPILPQLQNV